MIAGTEQRIVGLWAMPAVDFPVFPPMLLPGFLTDSTPRRTTVADSGELSFVIERLALQPQDLKPRNLPEPAEIHAEFLRLRNSSDRGQQRLAGLIAAAVGDSLLTESDVEPVMISNAVDRDLGSEVGFQQFCGHIGRLCDFRDGLVATCKSKRIRDKSAVAKCDLLPQQCDWCRTAPLCQSYLTGATVGCTAEEAAAREASLTPLRQNP
jgi:hypothetical protein